MWLRRFDPFSLQGALKILAKAEQEPVLAAKLNGFLLLVPRHRRRVN